jgi:hypothetical protein
MNLYELTREVYVSYFKNKFCEFFNNTEDEENEIIKSDLAELGLITTEVTEAMELVRDKKYGDKLGIELTDIIFRALNFGTRKGLNMPYYILEKIKINNKRPVKHGRKGI